MALPIPGAIEYEFNRTYIVVNPNAALGPPTYRLSNPDEIPGTGGGGISDIDTVLPITNITDATGNEEIGIDITQLDLLPGTGDGNGIDIGLQGILPITVETRPSGGEDIGMDITKLKRTQA
jgi:hypothetical protein